MKLVLFDFDHTVTQSDSFMGFLKHSVSFGKRFWVFFSLLPAIVQFKLGGDGEELKVRVLSKCFRGWSKEELESKGRSFAQQLDQTKNYKKSVYSDFLEHRRAGDKVVLVTASLDAWIEPWAQLNGVEVICTKLKYSNGSFTGELRGKNCNRSEKKQRVLEAFDLNDFEEIIAYGNPGPDDEMISIAHKQYRVPKKGDLV